ncbi:hypothetical protein NXX70_23445 [Bacteroides fragilis]|nr:hypothetical protein [Bacteroides fragilis]
MPKEVNERTGFYTSFGYTKQEGITLQSGYERITGLQIVHKATRYNRGMMFTNSTQNVNSEGNKFRKPYHVSGHDSISVYIPI